MRSGRAIKWQPFMPCENFNAHSNVSRVIQNPEDIGADPAVFAATRANVKPSSSHRDVYEPLKGVTAADIDQARDRIEQLKASIDTDADLDQARDQIATREQERLQRREDRKRRRQAQDQAMRDHYARKAEAERQTEEAEKRHSARAREERRAEKVAA